MIGCATKSLAYGSLIGAGEAISGSSERSEGCEEVLAASWLPSDGASLNKYPECVLEWFSTDDFRGVMGASNSNCFSPPDPNSYVDDPELVSKALFIGLTTFSFNGMRSGALGVSFSGVVDVEVVSILKLESEKAVKLVVPEDEGISP